MKENNKYKKGFTLNELIIVIAILAALAGLALVAYNGLIGGSRKTTCASNVLTVKREHTANFVVTADATDFDAAAAGTATSVNEAEIAASIKEAVTEGGGGAPSVTDTTVTYTDAFGDTITLTLSDDRRSVIAAHCSKHGDIKLD